MKIQKIEKLKNNKYKLLIDDEVFITFDNVILDNKLLYNKEIDKKIYNLIKKETEYYDTYNKVVKYILKKRRSEKQIIEYLNKFNVSEQNINKMILKLKNIGLINDIEYCKAYINDNIYLSKNGINKIKVELLKQDISIDIIEDELSKIDVDMINNKLERMIVKRIKSNRKYSNLLLKNKILNEMINLGYDKQLITSILENNMENENNIIKSEFEKNYIKLSKKYSGEELFNKIKLKMSNKGFSYEEINNLIEEKQKNI